MTERYMVEEAKAKLEEVRAKLSETESKLGETESKIRQTTSHMMERTPGSGFPGVFLHYLVIGPVLRANPPHLDPLSYGMPSALGALELLEVSASTIRDMM